MSTPVCIGLSPPTRGNRLQLAPKTPNVRSIPAHAGEPSTAKPSTAPPAVYPRPRGGTEAVNKNALDILGLSPPTRGNRDRQPSGVVWVRSIPAHAGEPRHTAGGERGARVYPRPRGGTDSWRTRISRGRGLSPPTRGNPAPLPPPRAPGRSIPAHAGEPPALRAPAQCCRVYPRPRGGTENTAMNDGGQSGLSPPTRGNRG